MEHHTTLNNEMIIYKSPLPDVDIPKISVFESVLPVNDLYPGERPALIDGITGETWSRNTLRAHCLTLAWVMVNRLGLCSKPPISLLFSLILIAGVSYQSLRWGSGYDSVSKLNSIPGRSSSSGNPRFQKPQQISRTNNSPITHSLLRDSK